MIMNLCVFNLALFPDTLPFACGETRLLLVGVLLKVFLKGVNIVRHLDAIPRSFTLPPRLKEATGLLAYDGVLLIVDYERKLGRKKTKKRL